MADVSNESKDESAEVHLLLPPPLLEFIRRFNADEYWESHEVLEGLWRINRSPFYQGLIIYASVFVHAQRGNPVGIVKQMHKANKYLEVYRPHYLGIDVEEILSHGAQCVALVQKDPALTGRRLSQSIRYPRLHPKRSYVLGTEPELL